MVFGLDHFIPYLCFIDTYVYLIAYWCFIVCWCFTTYWCFIFMYDKSETTWIKYFYFTNVTSSKVVPLNVMSYVYVAKSLHGVVAASVFCAKFRIVCWLEMRLANFVSFFNFSFFLVYMIIQSTSLLINGCQNSSICFIVKPTWKKFIWSCIILWVHMLLILCQFCVWLTTWMKMNTHVRKKNESPKIGRYNLTGFAALKKDFLKLWTNVIRYPNFARNSY